MSYVDRTIYLTRDSFSMGDDVMAPNLAKYTWRDTDYSPVTGINMIIEDYLGLNLPDFFWRGFCNGQKIVDVEIVREENGFSKKAKFVENWQELLRDSRAVHFVHKGHGHENEMPETIDSNYYSYEEAEAMFTEYPRNARDLSDGSEYSKRGLHFAITGRDYIKLRKFKIQHRKCYSGMTGDQFTYSFTPSGLGEAVTVSCSCGQKLLLGNFCDYEAEDYDPLKHPVMSEQDRQNEAFEKAIYSLLIVRKPRLFRIGFLTDQTFEGIYAYACGLAQNADRRFSASVLSKTTYKKNGRQMDNYETCHTDREKIDLFYEYFIKNIEKELSSYECKNEQLLKLLKEETQSFDI